MNFFKNLIAATLGTFFAFLIGFFILLIIVSTSSQEPEPYVRDNSILKITLSGPIPNRTTTDPLAELFNRQAHNKVSLQTLKENLAKATVDDKIKGVLLNINFVTASWANLQSARRMIDAFADSSGKFVYASTNDIGYNEKGYFIATAADSIFSPPNSFFEFDGFFTEVMFLDGLFEKLGIDPEVARHGQFKGAVEPFYRKELSESNEYQLQEILEDVNTAFLTAVSEKSGRSIDELNQMLNSQPHLSSKFAFRENLIDSLLYKNELKDYIKKRIGLEPDDSFEIISNHRYSQVSAQTAGLETASTSNEIAVIYASGPITPQAAQSPFGGNDVITADFFEEQLEEIHEDDDIKAIVIRINSPGGAGSTSDLIWHMIRETSEEMPVIVSMGGVAASGGYYIAMAADTIVAEPTTLTGSIGVFATKFNARELFNEELGLTFDGVKTHQHADWLTSTRGFMPAEAKAFQQFVDRFYRTFVTKVAKSRGMSVERADELGQGRVWTGADAFENGLVDALGGLDKALQIAAHKAEIDHYDIQRFPEPKSFYEVLLGSAGTQAKAFFNDGLFANPVIEKVQSRLSILKRNGALALFPYKIEIR
ncbi:MAG TPA: signal peptide peptidase SppA [Balneolaceae bacterium]|nr:signal peptide peptidase SppA [Balneolaceae bacterium]